MIDLLKMQNAFSEKQAITCNTRVKIETGTAPLFYRILSKHNRFGMEHSSSTKQKKNEITKS